jgi:hypothetical protein
MAFQGIVVMPIRLFHRTTKEGKKAILAGGFRDGEDGVVWFSALLDAWGAKGPHPLEVMLDMTETELAAYAVPVVSDEELMDDGETWQKCAEAEVEHFTWYKIPASLINPRGKVRPMSQEEVDSFECDLD